MFPEVREKEFSRMEIESHESSEKRFTWISFGRESESEWSEKLYLWKCSFIHCLSVGVANSPISTVMVPWVCL